jgi:hypothetical protein
MSERAGDLGVAALPFVSSTSWSIGDPRLLRVRMYAQRRRHRTDVFELVADPACYIIRRNCLIDRTRSLIPLGLVHLESAMQGPRGHLNIEGIDAQCVVAQLLMCTR